MFNYDRIVTPRSRTCMFYDHRARLLEFLTSDSVLSQYGITESELLSTQLNDYDENHARNENEKLALRAANLIMKICPKQFIEFHRDDLFDSFFLLESASAYSYWVNTSADLITARIIETRVKRVGKRELNNGEINRIRAKIENNENFRQRFRIFATLYEKVMEQELKYS